MSDGGRTEHTVRGDGGRSEHTERGDDGGGDYCDGRGGITLLCAQYNGMCGVICGPR